MGRQQETGWRLTSLALAWLAGVAIELQQAVLRPLAVSVAIGVAGGATLLLMLLLWFRVSGHKRIGHKLAAAAMSVVWAIGMPVGACALGFGLADVRANLLLAENLPASLEGRELIVTGVVATLPQRSSAGQRFQFDVEDARLADDGSRVTIPGTLAIGWYSGFHDEPAQPASGDASANALADLRAGQRWRFALKLRQPHGNVNPGGFDYELLLFEQGVRATGYVRPKPAPLLLERAAGAPVERLRQRVRDAIDASVPDRRAAGLLAALAVGDQGAIERDDWDLYRNTGIAHLVSISGLHITMFAWLAELIIGALWRRSGKAALMLPTPSAARWGGVILAAGYAVFSGWGVPSQRTVWMLCTVAALRSRGVTWPWPLVLLVAAFVVTLVDPWALLQAGFWLSFAAVGLLMASSPAATRVEDTEDNREREADGPPPTPAARAIAAGQAAWSAVLRTASEGFRTQLVATLGLAPLSLVFFQQISLVGFAANLVAIPLVTLVITPLALLGVVIVPLWTLATWSVGWLNSALELLAATPGAVWSVPSAPVWAQLGALIGATLVMLPLPWRVRLLGLPLLLGLALPPRDLPAPGAFELIAVDVGQGTAVLVRTRAHLLLFDSGPQYSRDSDAGKRVLVPLLRSRGETRVDRLVLSHRDLDHVGGARALFGAVPIGELLSSLEPEHPLHALAKGASKRCEAGQAWEWDGVRFAVLRPLAADYSRALKSNAMSCVVKVIDAQGHSALLTGDVERDQEAELVSRAAAGQPSLRSDVLFAPHHGSKTSSSAALLDAVAPRIAIVQAGYRNRFGHPAAEVLARYRDRGVRVVASPACGAWRWISSSPDAPQAAAPEGVCQRDAARRYWQHHVVDADEDADMP